MDSFKTLATLFGLGFFSGLNVYAVVFVSGLAIRFDWLTLTSGLKSLEVLSHPAVLITSGVMYGVEFVADKVPWVDNVWDVIHTAIRPMAAAYLALHVLGKSERGVENCRGIDLRHAGAHLACGKSRHPCFCQRGLSRGAVQQHRFEHCRRCSGHWIAVLCVQPSICSFGLCCAACNNHRLVRTEAFPCLPFDIPPPQAFSSNKLIA